MLSDDYLSKLFLRHHHDMLHLAWIYLKNANDAEDVVGDCWVSVLLHSEKLVTFDEAAAHSYLLRCVVNASIDLLRKKKRRAVWVTNAAKDEEASAPIISEDHVIDRLVMEAFYQTLPWREAQIFALRMQGFSFSAIASQLGISPSTARSYWLRIKQRLKKWYAPSVQPISVQND